MEKKFTLKSFERFGSPVVPMHMAIHALPMQLAIEKNIPLILWGENSAAEYGGDVEKLKGMEISSDWVMKYVVTNGTIAQDWVDNNLTIQELAPYYWPTDAELSSKNIRAVFLGQFFNWDPKITAALGSEHGFKAAENAVVGIFNFADVDDAFLMSIHHWLKWYKFGFTRSWDNLSIEIRAKRMTRSEAISHIKAKGYETPNDEIEMFCAYTDITRRNFLKLLKPFVTQIYGKILKVVGKYETFY